MTIVEAKKRLWELFHRLEASSIDLRARNAPLAQERDRDAQALQAVLEPMKTNPDGTCPTCGV